MQHADKETTKRLDDLNRMHHEKNTLKEKGDRRRLQGAESLQAFRQHRKGSQKGGRMSGHAHGPTRRIPAHRSHHDFDFFDLGPNDLRSQGTPPVEDLQNLLHEHGYDAKERLPSVSIYFPIEQEAGFKTTGNKIHLKNMIDEIIGQLKRDNIPDDQIEPIIDDVRQLGRDQFQSFTQQGAKGVVLFSSPNVATEYMVMSDIPRRFYVQDRFNIKDLSPMFAPGGMYHLLSITKGGVALYRGARGGIRPLDLPADMPKSFDLLIEKENIEFSDKPAYQATGNLDVAGGTYGKIYGSNDIDLEHRYLAYYCDVVAKSIDVSLSGKDAPLILMGPDAILPRIRKSLRYPHIIDHEVRLSPEYMNTNEAFTHLEPILEAWQKDVRGRAKGEFTEGRNTSQTTTGIQDTLTAAYRGQIKTLLFSRSAESIWGFYDAEKGQLITHDEKQPGDFDLIGEIVTQSFLSSSHIIDMDPGFEEEISSPVAAILRW